jgi:cation transporter family protein
MILKNQTVYIFLFSVLHLPTCVLSISSTSMLAAQKFVRNILNNSSYNADVRPTVGGEDNPVNATLVSVNLLVRAIDDVDDLKMRFTMQITLRQRWMEQRIEFESDDPDIEYVTLDDALITKIWKPDIFFSNEASSFQHKLMLPNHYVRVYRNGEILWSSRLTLVFTCPMKFQYFPFDHQTCYMRLSTYSSTMKDVVIDWENATSYTPVYLMEKASLPRFQVNDFEFRACTQQMLVKSKYRSSCIYASVDLKRQFGLYVIQVYIPSTLFVMLSWISFWLGHFASARLSLTLTILLTMATQFQGLNLNTPQVAYMRAIDLWSGFCTTIVSLAVLESAVVVCLMQRKSQSFIKTNEVRGLDTVMNDGKDSQKALKLDSISKYLFPLSFLLFSLIYLYVYLIVENDSSDIESRFA